MLQGVAGGAVGYRIEGGAPTASVPLLPLPVRALRVSQGRVRAVCAAWPVAEGPGQAAREERARGQAQISPYVAVEVGNSTQGSRRRREGEGGGEMALPHPWVRGPM